ncbi:UNVERIFIED_CONTAM: hypothetical protein Sindi_2634900 [Sesamum indicum]
MKGHLLVSLKNLPARKDVLNIQPPLGLRGVDVETPFLCGQFSMMVRVKRDDMLQELRGVSIRYMRMITCPEHEWGQPPKPSVWELVRSPSSSRVENVLQGDSDTILWALLFKDSEGVYRV